MVFIDDIRPGMVAGEDIHSPEDFSTVLIRKGTVLTAIMIHSLRMRQIRFAYIDEKPRRAVQPTAGFSKPKARKLYVPEPKPVLTPQVRDTALDSLEELFVSVGEMGKEHSVTVIKHLDSVVGELVSSIHEEPSALININDLKSYDEYTFHHSLSVAVLSLAIGQHLGFDKKALHRLGMSAIMHDIGKMAVPVDLINKPSRLTGEEFEIIKSHSPEGYEYLLGVDYRDEDILEGVLFHHEKYDGTGYPKGLKGESIPLWSRIISVADVYDALTSKRPYRDPMQPAEAIEYIMGGIETLFDYDVAKAFVDKVELYPVGSRILLSNGKIGQVLNNENQMRPVIRLADSGDIMDLYRDHSTFNIVVTRLLAG